MALKLERLDVRHIGGMVRIENECFSEPWAEKALCELVDCPYAVYFVAVDENGNAAGYGGMYILGDIGSINNIGVLPEYRRQHIGSRLLEALIEYARENCLSALELEVRQSNLGAVSLYEKHGFAEVGRRRGFYRKPTEDAVLYNLEIKK